MRLALNTAAAAGFTFDEILAACRRRGFAGVALEAGHAHGVEPGLPAHALASIRDRADAAGIRIVAFHAASQCDAFTPEAAVLAGALGAPVVAPVGGRPDPAGAPAGARTDRPGVPGAGRSADVEPAPASGDAPIPDPAALAEAARRYAAAGGTLLLTHGTDPAQVNALCRTIAGAPTGALGLAWDADPADDGFASRIPAVLRAAGPYLRHVLLHGGGPEAVQQDGHGIGPLMAHLALARYDGAVALTPTTPRYRMAWSAWLGHGGGWGCGSKAADASLVILDTTA